MIEPAETQHRKVKVKKLWKRRRETIEVKSIKEGIEEIKSSNNIPPTTQKLILDGEIVYNSDRNGDISNWESEWKRQKRTLSVNKSAHDCPNGVVGCSKDDLCYDCQIEKARTGSK